MTEGPRQFDTAAELLLDRMAERGVEYVLGNAGTDFPSIIEALSRAAAGQGRAPTPITVPHENLAMAMAHGLYLGSGTPAAVMLHVNVGTANAVCGLINAARDNIPVLLAAGRTPVSEGGAPGSRSVFIHWGQEMFDQAGMVREAVKWDYELRRPEQAADAVDRALGLAMSEPRGPVYLTLPREVLAAAPGAVAPPPRVAAAPAAPDPGAVDEVAGWLAAAENPVIVTASYGRDPGDTEALARLAEAAAVPVVGYRPRYVFLPTGHPMHLGLEPGPFLAEADLIVVLECDVPWIPNFYDVNAEARVVQVGADPLFGQYPMRGFRADAALAGRPAATVTALADALDRQGPDAARIEARRERLAARREEMRRGIAETRAKAAEAGAMTNPWVVACVDEAKGPDDIVLTETALPMQMMAFERPGTYFGTSPAGGLGWGLGASLGLKMARRERRVILMVGDGSYMFGNPTPAHLVAAAHDLPFLTVILNNRMWGAVRRATLGLYPDGAAAKSNQAPLTMLEPSPAYEKVVEASGGYGERVEDPAELPAALARGLAAVDRGQQAVLNVLTHYSDQEAVRDARR